MKKEKINELIEKLEYLETHNKNYTMKQYYLINESLEILKNEKIELLKQEYKKHKNRKLKINDIDFNCFDNLYNLSDREFKKLYNKACYLFYKWSGNNKEIFKNNSCFISSSSLHGFYFPNDLIISCISFIDGKAFLILK